jgi:hypothetical protein
MSTIKFNHTKTSFSEALGLDDNDICQLAKTMSGMMKDVCKNNTSKSEIAELIAKTCSFTEILILATEGFQAKMDDVTNHFKEVIEDKDLANEKDIKEFERKLKSKMSDIKTPIKMIEVDPTDINGSLDRAGIPDDIKAELKLQILKVMRDRLSDQE